MSERTTPLSIYETDHNSSVVSEQIHQPSNEHSPSIDTNRQSVETARASVESSFSEERPNLEARHVKPGVAPRYVGTWEHNPERAQTMAIAENNFRNENPEANKLINDMAKRTPWENIKDIFGWFFSSRIRKRQRAEDNAIRARNSAIGRAGRAYDQETGTAPTFVHDINQAHAMAEASKPHVEEAMRIKRNFKEKGLWHAVKNPKETAKQAYLWLDHTYGAYTENRDARLRYHGYKTSDDKYYALPTPKPGTVDKPVIPRRGKLL